MLYTNNIMEIFQIFFMLSKNENGISITKKLHSVNQLLSKGHVLEYKQLMFNQIQLKSIPIFRSFRCKKIEFHNEMRDE